MLASAFNLITRLHSRSATLRRLAAAGDPDEVTDVRITPSNYFRQKAVVGDITMEAKEFIIPKDSMPDLLTAPYVRVGDRIEDGELGIMSIVEVIELYDLGGSIMGYRVRCE